MNKFELDKIMECLGFDKKECYVINGWKYHHDGRYFTIVNGKTPYELATLISNKYDNSIYKIRVNGNNEMEIPHGDIYTYHIDTVEGLVAFLLETQDYYSKTQEASKNFEQFLHLVYSKILQDVNPNIRILNLMLNNKARKNYFETLENANTYLDSELRKRIESFDNIVNPFFNNDLDLNNSTFIVRGNGHHWFSLIDKDSRITMTTIRRSDGFVIKLCVPLEVPYEITVYHNFGKNGEEIAFEKYDESGISRIEYNLTNSSFGEHYGEKHTATEEDKKFVIQNLDKYITIASDIVKKNVKFGFTSKKILKK